MFACRNQSNAAVEIVSLIINSLPCAESMRVDAGLPLLFTATTERCTPAVLDFLLKYHTSDVLHPHQQQDAKFQFVHAACMRSDSIEMVQQFLTKYPDTLATVNNKGMLPLHCACFNGTAAAASIISCVTTPEAVQTVAQWHRSLPLHLAAGYSGSLEAVQHLMAQYPQALAAQNSDGYLPLHSACMLLSRKKSSPTTAAAITLAIMEAAPEALQADDDKGKLPLHIAAGYSDSLEVVQGMITLYPEALAAKDDDGCLPLHAACHNKSSPTAATAIILAILEAAPEALQAADSEGRLPLHIAAGYSESLEAVQRMLSLHPEALAAKDDDGCLPLHAACHNKSSPTAATAIILAILEAAPEALQAADSEGRLPLHIAARYSESLEAVQRMLSLHPEALAVKDDDGCLPLHAACACDNQNATAATAIILAILEAAPEALQAADSEGRLPLHNAARYSESLEAVQRMMSLHPEALAVKDSAGCVPLHAACGNQSATSATAIILAILEAAPDALQVKDKRADLPLHLAMEQSLQVVQHMIDLFPSSVEMMNEMGYLPLHAACMKSTADIVAILLSHPCSGKEIGKGKRKGKGNTSLLSTSLGVAPLHLAVRNSSYDVLDVIRLVMEKDPKQLMAKCPSLDATPIIIAIKSTGATLAVHIVRILHSCWQKEGFSDLELCSALWNERALEIAVGLRAPALVDYLLTSLQLGSGEASVVQSNNGMLQPLHTVCRYDSLAAVPILKSLLSSAPGLVWQLTEAGESIIHLACSRSSQLEAVQMLLSAHSDSQVLLGTQTAMGDLPIHCAVRNKTQAGANIVRLLLDLAPHQITSGNHMSQLPLHIAIEVLHNKEDVCACANCENCHTVPCEQRLRMVNAVLSSDSTQHKDCNGKLPIDLLWDKFGSWHGACSTSANCGLTIGLLLLDTAPSLLATGNQGGCLELHSLIRKFRTQANVELLRRIVQNHAQSLCLNKAVNGETPLHLICYGYCAFPVAEAIIEACPQSVQTRDATNHMTPLKIACECSNEPSLVQLLLEKDIRSVINSRLIRGVPDLLFSALHNSNTKVLTLVLRALAKVKVQSGSILHTACLHSSSPDVLKLLVSSNSKELSHPVVVGESAMRLPLEHACHNTSDSLSEIFAVVFEKTRRVAPMVIDQLGLGHMQTEEAFAFLRLREECCLHRLCRDGFLGETELKLFHSVLMEDPGSVQRYDQFGQLPLHLLCAHSQSVQATKLLLAADPDAPTHKDKTGDLALHIALRNMAPRHFLKLLVEGHTSASQCEDSQGCPPMQLACLQPEQCRDRSYVLSENAELILQMDPNCLSKPQRNGQLPLHILADRIFSLTLESSKDFFTKMLRLYPGARLIKDNHGNLPLHLALEAKTSKQKELTLQISERILTLFDSDVLSSTNSLVSPLYTACAHDFPSEFIKKMITMHPEALVQKPWAPLNSVYTRPSENAAAIILAALDAAPTIAEQAILANESALHLVCKHSCSFEVVQRLLALTRSCTKDANMALPLHCACLNTTSAAASIILAVMKRTPEAVKVEHSRHLRELPLHIAAECNSSVQVISDMIALYPEALTVKNTHDCLPLHAACHNKSSPTAATAIILAILEAAPEALQAADSEGRLPLHIAARYSESLEVVQLMLTLCPEGLLAVKDQNGMQPLHWACENTTKQAPSVVQTLLESFPAALKESCAPKRAYFDVGSFSGRDFLPLHIACKRTMCFEVLQILIQADPSALGHLAVQYELYHPNWLPLHIFLCRQGDSEGLVAPAIKALTDPAVGRAALVTEPGGITLASKYALYEDNYFYFSGATSISAVMMKHLLLAAPSAIWTIPQEQALPALRECLKEARLFYESAWHLEWSPTSHINAWMPSDFKAAMFTILLAYRRKDHFSPCPLGRLTNDLLCQIIRFSAAAWLQPPMLDFPTLRHAMSNAMFEEDIGASEAVFRLAGGTLTVTPEQLGVLDYDEILERLWTCTSTNEIDLHDLMLQGHDGLYTTLRSKLLSQGYMITTVDSVIDRINI